MTFGYTYDTRTRAYMTIARVHAQEHHNSGKQFRSDMPEFGYYLSVGGDRLDDLLSIERFAINLIV